MYKRIGGEGWKTVSQTEQWLLLEMYNNPNTVKLSELFALMLMHVNSTTPWNKDKIDKWPQMTNAKSANTKFSLLLWKEIANLYEINVPFEMAKYLLLLSLLLLSLLLENSKCGICLQEKTKTLAGDKRSMIVFTWQYERPFKPILKTTEHKTKIMFLPKI